MKKCRHVQIKANNCLECGAIICPGCGVEITVKNVGGYRAFCDKCVKAMPPFPKDGKGHLIKEGCKYPNFEWE